MNNEKDILLPCRFPCPFPPVCLASQFANTRTFLAGRLKRGGRDLKKNPISHEEWKRFTEEYARKKGVKGWTWIGEKLNLNQVRENAFFIDNRSLGLPSDTVQVIPP
jgi:hypothetical protein